MKIEFYIDNQFETRWRAVADNGKIVAESGEGYTERRDAEHGFDVLREAIIGDYEMSGEDLDIRFVGRDSRSQNRIQAHNRDGS